MIRLRPAEPQDEWTFFEIRRQIQPELTRETHVKWWQDTWEHRYVAYDGPATVGVIRISPCVPREFGIIHLQVVKKEQGKGLGTQMLVSIQRVARDLGFATLIAEVEPTNVASQKAFLGAGYKATRFEVAL